MTELKKQFIVNALSEITDDFVAEAIEYQKPKQIWRYTRELATVAACVAVLLVSLNVLRIIPIDSMQETASEAMPEDVISAENESAASGNVEQLVDKVIGVEEQKEMLYSKGITWEEVFKEEKEATKDLCGYPILESVQTTSYVSWMSAEEILASDIDIFLGTVMDMQTYRVTGGLEKYFTIATVEVEDSIRSELGVGDTCQIYLPFAEVDEVTTTTSIIGDLEKLEIGSRAIFMPRKTTIEAGEGSGDTWLSYLDFSDYYFGEGKRFLFLETENGTNYATDVYEVDGGREASLEEIAAYLRDVLEQ